MSCRQGQSTSCELTLSSVDTTALNHYLLAPRPALWGRQFTCIDIPTLSGLINSVNSLYSIITRAGGLGDPCCRLSHSLWSDHSLKVQHMPVKSSLWLRQRGPPMSPTSANCLDLLVRSASKKSQNASLQKYQSKPF